MRVRRVAWREESGNRYREQRRLIQRRGVWTAAGTAPRSSASAAALSRETELGERRGLLPYHPRPLARIDRHRLEEDTFRGGPLVRGHDLPRLPVPVLH